MTYENSPIKIIKMTSIIVIILISIYWYSNFSDDEDIDVEYYTNPKVLYGRDFSDDIEIEGNRLIQENEKLKIKNQEIKTEIKLPANKDIQSIELSHDKQHLAFDVANKENVRMFVVNLETGNYEYLANVVERKDFNYKPYKKPHGLAWSPKENILVFVEGHQDTNGDSDYESSSRINAYHPELDLQDVAGGVFLEEEIYGVRWDTDGDAIYYVATRKDQDKYDLYQTSIDLYQIDTDLVNEKDFRIGEEYGIIEKLDYKEVESWLEKHN
ncbi:hypothetical protein [Natranaerofaba carboxydovora]|uniref:hypothetical protein n=1 Tax=Natranaerofaba carboxydovora TaxID=2742683 RepID=UPI001F12CB6D|nr:hypothetical protein [Natranaerofaba carboxydovora]UMZ74397.1 hypothetical protein ACONDI_01985 [Natranaerofaba carboxydovora]